MNKSTEICKLRGEYLHDCLGHDDQSAPAVCSPSDTERLDWLIANSAYVSWSRDNEVCNVWFRWCGDDDGGPVEGYPQKCHHDAREAIDAAMRARDWRKVNAEAEQR